MKARVMTVQIQPDKLDESLRIFRESVVPAAQEFAGNKALLLLTDRPTGKGMSISIWDDDDLARSESSGYLRDQLGKFGSLFAAPPVREVFDVAVWERARSEPTHGRITTAQLKPGMTEAAEQYMRDTLVPMIREQPGCVGFMFLIDRATGKGITATAWESLDALHANEAPGGPYQQGLAGAAQFLAGQPSREVFEVSVRAVRPS